MGTHDSLNPSRRRFIKAASVSAAATLFNAQNLAAEVAGSELHAAAMAEPTSSLKLNKSDTAVVIIDPQNDVLSEKGLSWPLLHESLKEINTVENIERIFKAAKALGFEVFISTALFLSHGQGMEV